MICVEDIDKLIEIAFRALLVHYSGEPEISGVKLISKTNSHILQVCMASFEKFMDSKK